MAGMAGMVVEQPVLGIDGAPVPDAAAPAVFGGSPPTAAAPADAALVPKETKDFVKAILSETKDLVPKCKGERGVLQKVILLYKSILEEFTVTSNNEDVPTINVEFPDGDFAPTFSDESEALADKRAQRISADVVLFKRHIKEVVTKLLGDQAGGLGTGHQLELGAKDAAHLAELGAKDAAHKADMDAEDAAHKAAMAAEDAAHQAAMTAKDATHHAKNVSTQAEVVFLKETLTALKQQLVDFVQNEAYGQDEQYRASAPASDLQARVMRLFGKDAAAFL